MCVMVALIGLQIKGDFASIGLETHITEMDSVQMQYLTGEEIHAGDRVQYGGTYATVVFVSDGNAEQAAPGFEDYAGSRRGLVIWDDDGVTTEVGEPDERLYFVSRG